jgi:GNAT superfamily N-acetyltransferase
MSPIDFTIRRASEADMETAQQMIEALGYANIEPADFKRAFTETLNHRDSFVLLAIATNGRGLGLMTLSRRPQMRLAGILLSIDELVVIAEARGLGVGGALLKEAKRIAATIGARRLELHTNRGRESYRREFYVKNGFTEINSAVMRMEKDFIKE